MSTKTKSTNCRDLTLTNRSFGSLYSFGVGVGSDAVNEMKKQELGETWGIKPDLD